MGSYTIGQVAERSGFSATTLRYYEEIGLVVAPGRTAAGYRLYDDHSLARLTFVACAKQLGCTLEEISDLVTLADGERCAPVQARFHRLVTAKLAETERRIAELHGFALQLRIAASRLGMPPVDGPCDDCACVDQGGPPVVCTIAPSEVEGRLELLERMRERLVDVQRTGDGMVLRFDVTGDVAADLRCFVDDELRCCPFWLFEVTTDSDEHVLRWGGPPAARDLLDELHGFFAHRRPLPMLR